jgi:hypothetical protein
LLAGLIPNCTLQSQENRTMRRTTRITIGSFLLLAASTAVLAQPANPPATGPDFYPLKVGNKWTYKVGDTTTIEMKVDKLEGGEATLSTSVNGKQVASEAIKATPEGILRTKINNTEIKPPVMILKLPPKKDTKWDVKSKITVAGQEHAIEGSFTIKDDKEKLKVRDKDYETVVVDGPNFNIAGTTTAVKYWFAAGTGVVKLTYNIAGNEAVLELTEFTPGK